MTAHQPALFDIPPGDNWATRADTALAELAAAGIRFTADDLLDRVGHPDDTHTPNARNNQVGAAFQRAHRAGLIVVVDHAKSRAPHRKGGLVRVWSGT